MRHVYVHVPFCVRRCVYCDFHIAVRRQVPAERYVRAVLREAKLRRSRGQWDADPCATLYLGGGTPSLLPPDALVDLVGRLLDAEGGGAAPLEMTVEANPDDVTEAAAEAWVRGGVNRVSLGVQSFDAGTLAWMHRSHRSEQSERAVSRLRAAGVPSVSIDLIFGIPTAPADQWMRDVEHALRLDPDHVSAYGLTLEPRTPLWRRRLRREFAPVTDRRFEAEFLHAHDALTGAGYCHYEVSNYGRPGHESKHNWAYWTGAPYAGLGPSAHAYCGGVRRWNEPYWTEYERVVGVGGDPTAGQETLTESQVRLERVYLGLRTSAGLGAEEVGNLNAAAVERAVRAGWMECAGEVRRLTPRGWLRLDELAVALTTSAGGG